MSTSVKKWDDLSEGQQAGLAAAAAVQLSLFAAALIDLVPRRASKVRGPKLLWFFLSFINFVGPLAYFVVGRRRTRS